MDSSSSFPGDVISLQATYFLPARDVPYFANSVTVPSTSTMERRAEKVMTEVTLENGTNEQRRG
jgi:hypothetical protein